MSLDPAIAPLLNTHPVPVIRKGDSEATMLLRIFEAFGYDFNNQAWYSPPEEIAGEPAKTLVAAANELFSRTSATVPWSEAFEKPARELVVLVRAWERAEDPDKEVLADLIAARQDELQKLFGYMSDALF